MGLKKFIFSNNFFYRAGRHVAFWIARLFFMVPFNGGLGYNFELGIFENFSRMLGHFLPFLLFSEIPHCYIVVYFLYPRFILKKRYKIFILSIAIIIIADISFRLFTIVGKDSVTAERLFMIVFNLLSDYMLIFSPTVCGLFLTIKIFKSWYLRQQENQMLVKANADAEKILLKAQIHPHFLFNTLNNIYSFTLDKSPKAEELVSSLFEIMKYMVNDCNVEMMALDKEIKMLQHYIELERVRYGDRLDIQIEIQGAYEDKTVTPLLMIPFVENSFKHGASKMVKDPWINLFIQADETVLHFILSNNKPANALKKDGKNGIGLANARKRLQLLYPDQHLLRIEETNSIFNVNMQIPLEKIKEPLKQFEEVYG